ncbi:MAG TPA: decaprenyl-phosphate phosphoribosyltransferase [Nitrospirae bacterium]|nr:decaprenyl-phosphate phosphoribosyltransferase [bacterium BMS3Abin06]HDH10815.1 decaprenyl-phosphate phosphoribosyltransferase [Nitrospirota bacterium]HDZ00941.1 decaprenyl-phosphate phosphoribosyltransferase [Nitrospirota bacterium]
MMRDLVNYRNERISQPAISSLRLIGSQITAHIKILRIKHWIKNFLLFAAPFFGGNLFLDKTVLMALPVFLAFSSCASAAYIFNDIKDYKKDRLHPAKKKRPVASNGISIPQASLLAVSLLLPSLILSYFIAPLFFYLMFSYIIIQAAYSLHLKDIAVVDIFCIASGFVIRVLAGGAAFRVEVSPWLLLSMFMISLVLASGKRLSEASLLNGDAVRHRKSLEHSYVSSLHEILLISSASSLIAYAMYTVEMYQSLVYTIPVATFGLFRYIILSKQGMGDPTEALTKDKWLAMTVMMWLLLVGFIRYN